MRPRRPPFFCRPSGGRKARIMARFSRRRLLSRSPRSICLYAIRRRRLGLYTLTMAAPMRPPARRRSRQTIAPPPVCLVSSTGRNALSPMAAFDPAADPMRPALSVYADLLVAQLQARIDNYRLPPTA